MGVPTLLHAQTPRRQAPTFVVTDTSVRQGQFQAVAISRDTIVLRRWSDGDYEEKLLLVMVESQEAIDNLPALLKMKEIDVFYFGQNDLAESMGFKGDRKHPKVRGAVEDAIKRVADAGKVPGMNVQDEIDAVTHYLRLGLRWINVHQKNFMERGAKAFLKALEE